MWSPNIITLYSESHCHLLSWYLHNELPTSEIYILTDNDRVIHSLIAYKKSYYDIYGRFESPEDIIKHWSIMYNLENCKLHLMTDISELSFDEYTKEDHKEAQLFVKKNITTILDSDLVSDSNKFKDNQGYVDVSEIIRKILRGEKILF